MNTFKKILLIVLCTFLSIAMVVAGMFSFGMYLFLRTLTPTHLSVIPMSESKIINCFYEYEDEIVNIAYQLRIRPEENLDWYYFSPDEVTSWNKSVWTPDKEGDFYKNLLILKKEGFVQIYKRGNYVMFERWGSVSAKKGIIYSETDPKEHFASGDYCDLKLKKTKLENFYYFSINYDWG